MADWAKQRSLSDKIMVDFLYHKYSNMLSKIYRQKFKLLSSKYSGNETPNEGITPKLVYSGNISLDLAGQWRTSDCRDKLAEPIVARAIHNIGSNAFPSFTCAMPTTIVYQWLKSDFPETLQEIQNLIREEKWDIIGGALVNYTGSIIDGESLIRQYLYGQRFNARVFNQLAEVTWIECYSELSQAIPQILSKSGVNAAIINKNSSPKLKKKKTSPFPFPFLHFTWAGLDESEIQTSWLDRKDIANIFPILKENHYLFELEKKTSFNRVNYSKEIQKNVSKVKIPHFVIPYGAPSTKFGPQPMEIMEKMLWEEQNLVENTSLTSFFKKMRSIKNQTPTWQDSLQINQNEGIFTSLGYMKENNKTCEVLLHQVEAISTISGIMGGDHFQDEIQRDWALTLLLQDKEILSGNSICEVYRDAANDYKQQIAHLLSAQENAVMNASQFLKENLKHNFYTVFNPLGWTRSGYSTVFRKNYNHAMDHKNKPLIVQRVSFSPYSNNREFQLGVKNIHGMDYLKSNAKLIKEIGELSLESQQFLPKISPDKDELTEFENLPRDFLLIYHPKSSSIGSYGLENVSFLKSPPHTREAKQKFKLQNDLYIFKSDAIFIKIDATSGFITHLSNNKEETNMLTADGIGYKLYYEKPKKADPIQIDPNYFLSPYELPPLEEIRIEEEGPLRHTLLIKYGKTKQGSRIHTRISVYHKDMKVYGETLVDWREKNKILKLEINPSYKITEITTGKPFSIEHTSLDTLKKHQEMPIEVSFQQFVALTNHNLPKDTHKNLVIYSQSKYGLGIAEDNASLSLLRSPKIRSPNKKYARLDPDYETRSKYMDHGFHRIPWAIESVDEPIDEMHVLKTAYEYNVPIIYAPTNAVHDKISFFTIDSPNVLITTVKEIEEFMRAAPDWFYNPSMNELAFIVRCVEFGGKATTCKLKIPEFVKIKKIIEVDLLERIQNNGISNSEIKLETSTISFPIKPYEIKSMMVITRIPSEEEY